MERRGRSRKPLPWVRGLLLTALVVATVETGGRAAIAQSAVMREPVYRELSKAETAAEAGDFEEALKVLGRLEKMKDLSSYERAQLYAAYGFLHFSRESYRESIDSYNRVLEQEPLPEQIETSTLYTLAQLQFQVEDYLAAIEHLDEWLGRTERPGPEAYILKGQAYYQLERYRDALEPVKTAISIAEATDRKVAENWYLLLRVLHYELEEWEEVLDILEILVTRYPKREYYVQLGAMYGRTGSAERQLAAYEMAYLQGFLERSDEIVLYAQLLLQAGVPHRAARVLEEGIADGRVEKSVANLRLLSQAWMLAGEDDQAITPLTEAAGLSDDGELDARLAQAYGNTREWEKSAEAAQRALRKGVDREYAVRITLGMALFELERREEARSAFREAANAPEGRATATQWIRYIESEQARLAELERSVVTP
jgi:tetratricopeptide (TPR) repeat protein